MIRIEVHGPDGAGKGLVMAAISRALSMLGMEVHLQGEVTHNKKKVALTEDELKAKLKDRKVVITEMQTS